MTKAILKTEKTRAKLQELEAQYKESLERRTKDLIDIMNALDLSSVNGYALIGGLLDIKEKAKNQNAICEDWRKAGQNYLKRTKRRAL